MVVEGDAQDTKNGIRQSVSALEHRKTPSEIPRSDKVTAVHVKEDVIMNELPANLVDSDATSSKRARKSTARATATDRRKLEDKPLVPMFGRKVRTQTVDLDHIHKLTKEGCIDLNADYQRDVVWPTNKQSALIDSLINYVHVPELVFCTRNSESEDLICMDGKQRITSIKRFMDGEIGFKDFRSGKQYYYCKNPKSKTSNRRVIDPASKRRFQLTVINIVIYDDITVEQQREIFGRVQNGTALTPAERVCAINSDKADLVRAAEAHVRQLDDPVVADCMRADGNRFYVFAQLAMLILNNKSEAPNALRTERWLQTNSAVSDSQTCSFFRTINILLAIMPDMSDLGIPSGAELVMAGYLVHHNASDYTLAQLATGVRALRTKARAYAGARGHIKLSAAMYTTMKTFARGGLKSCVPYAARGMPRAATVVPARLVSQDELRTACGSVPAVLAAPAATEQTPDDAPLRGARKRKEGPDADGAPSAKRSALASSSSPVVARKAPVPLPRKRKLDIDGTSATAKKLRSSREAPAAPDDSMSATTSATQSAPPMLSTAASTAPAAPTPTVVAPTMTATRATGLHSSTALPKELGGGPLTATPSLPQTTAAGAGAMDGSIAQPPLLHAAARLAPTLVHMPTQAAVPQSVPVPMEEAPSLTQEAPLAKAAKPKRGRPPKPKTAAARKKKGDLAKGAATGEGGIQTAEESASTPLRSTISSAQTTPPAGAPTLPDDPPKSVLWSPMPNARPPPAPRPSPATLSTPDPLVSTYTSWWGSYPRSAPVAVLSAFYPPVPATPPPSTVQPSTTSVPPATTFSLPLSSKTTGHEGRSTSSAPSCGSPVSSRASPFAPSTRSTRSKTRLGPLHAAFSGGTQVQASRSSPSSPFGIAPLGASPLGESSSGAGPSLVDDRCTGAFLRVGYFGDSSSTTMP